MSMRKRRKACRILSPMQQPDLEAWSPWNPGLTGSEPAGSSESRPLREERRALQRHCFTFGVAAAGHSPPPALPQHRGKP